jgi:hypothetical protein
MVRPLLHTRFLTDVALIGRAALADVVQSPHRLGSRLCSERGSEASSAKANVGQMLRQRLPFGLRAASYRMCK